jgi:nicotinamidase-related amidase
MSDTAVVVVDMMNTYQHSDAEELIPNVEKIMDPLADLLRRARKADGVDVVYINDNYGDFTAQFSDIVGSALDAYVRHSPVGIPTQHNQAIAHIDAEPGDAALKMMQQNMSAELITAADCLGWIGRE